MKKQIKKDCTPIKYSSKLYLEIIERGLLEFTISELADTFGNRYAQGTYSTFPAKHCCDGKCLSDKNSKGYTIYFCRIARGRYMVICNRVCPKD
jgi:hypothetical protein